MSDRSKYHKIQIRKLDDEILRLEKKLREVREVQGIHFNHLRKGT